MSLTIYALHFSQADRVVWLCEELLPLNPRFKYNLKIYHRGLDSSEGKQTLWSIHPAGTSPTIVDTLVDPPVTMAESQAIMTYILTMYGKGNFAIPPPPASLASQYSQFLYWMSFANGSFQASITTALVVTGTLAGYNISVSEATEKLVILKLAFAKIPNHLSQFESRLSESKYLGGEEFTVADIMNIYGLTVMRGFYPIDLSPYPNLLKYLKTVTDRPAYVKAMEVAEDGLPAFVQAKVPQFSIEVAMGMKGWKSLYEEGGAESTEGLMKNFQEKVEKVGEW